MPSTADELARSLGISLHAAKMYLAFLEHGAVTLTEIARYAGLARTVTTKPLNELLDLRLISKKVVGKRLKYAPLDPSELPRVLELKRSILSEVSKTLTRQITADEQDLQVRWFSGIVGIQNAFREFFSKSEGDFRHFENSETYNYIGRDFAESLIDFRVEAKQKNRVIVISGPAMDSWYKHQIEKDPEQLRETITVSEGTYPFKANIAASENLVMIFEYRQKPFALLIENRFVAESIRSVHQMIWDRYRSE